LSRQQPGPAGQEDKVVASPRRRAVFLDRDGVLVVPEFRDGRSFAPRTLEKFRLYDDAPKALAALKEAGFLLIVVTNQPDIGNGLVAAEVVDEMHRRLLNVLPIDRIELCPHSQREHCGCRKPKPRMLLNAAELCGIALSQSVIIGDRSSDIEAGRAVGCSTVFIDLKYENEVNAGADWTAHSISEAADIILRASVPEGEMT